MTETPTSNFWRFLELLAVRRTLIFTIVSLTVLASVVVSLLLPKWYLAEALLLPPKDASLPQVGKADLAELASIVGGVQLPVMVTPSDVYARMLRSRAIIDRIIEQFGLKDRYHAATMFETRQALLKHAQFRVTEEGLVSIRVEDHDPATAAQIANRFVDELDSLNHRIVSQRASRNRQFIEDRLDAVTVELNAARRSLQDFQSKNRALDFDEQTRMAIEQATALKTDLARLDVDLTVKKQMLGEQNPQLEMLQERRRSIKIQLDRLEYGGSDTSYFSLPLESIPTLKGRFEILYSKVKVSEAIYSTLLELLEQAKIQEQSKNVPLSVLDRASPPELRSRPQRTLIVLGSFAVSLIFAVLLAAFLEHFRQLETTRPDDYLRATHFVSAYLGWLPGVRRTTKERGPNKDG